VTGGRSLAACAVAALLASVGAAAARADGAWNRYAAGAAWSFARNGYGLSAGADRALLSPRPWLHAVAGADLTYLQMYPFEPAAGLQPRTSSATLSALGGLLAGHQHGRLQGSATLFLGLQRFMRDDLLQLPALMIEERLRGAEWTVRFGAQLAVHARLTRRVWLFTAVQSAIPDIQVSHLAAGVAFTP
jgi:hypothetical protein